MKIVSFVHFCLSIEEHDYSANLLGDENGKKIRKTVCKFLC
jgi:hypothetical protein